jgi:hypothetical protein
MTDNKKEFDNFLKKEEEKKKPPVDWNAKKKEWFQHLNKLYADIQEWLNDYIKNERIKLEFSDFDIYEETLGKYTVQELKIYIGNNLAQLTPIGTVLIGTKGRVDLSGPLGTIKLILTDRDATKPNISFRMVLSDEEEKKYEEVQKLVPKKKLDWVWKISSNPPNIHYTELNEDTFYDCLIRVING